MPFHYNTNNIQFLYMVIDNILETYEYDTNIIIDTNTEETLVITNKYPNIQIYVHSLEHPFHLTYVHRKHILKNIDNYDIILYSEDDILIPFNTIKNFMEKINYMWPKYIPGFKRCEFSIKNNKYASPDVAGKQTIKTSEIIRINGERYFTPKYPNFAYQGFWLLPTKLLKENINIDSFLTMNIFREHAASYTLGPPPYHCYDDNYKGNMFLNKIPLIQLNDKNQIDEICLVYHTPNKYVDVFESPLIDELIIIED